MVFEATMICVDNSEWMRNEDYRPSRFAAQSDAVAMVCSAKMQANLESSVGVLAMAGRRGVSVLVTPTNDFGEVLARMQDLEIVGEVNLTAAIQVAQLALKNRQNKQQQQRIIVFVGSPVIDAKNVLEAIGEKLKKNNVALDVVDFGESDDEKPEKLEALVAAVSSGGNSHIIHVLPGEDFLSNVILSSPILAEDQKSVSAAAARRASGFEFCVDPNVDPELALVLQVSMEEERARQQAAAEESSETESTCQSSTSNDETVMADTEPELNLYTEDQRNLQKDEDQLWQQAHAMSIEDGNPGTLRAADAELLKAVADEVEFVLQMSVQEQGTGAQSDMNEVFWDQPFSQSMTYALPGAGADLDDLLLYNKDLQEWHELLIGPHEARKQRRKQRKKQQKQQQRKHEEKEDAPEGDKSIVSGPLAGSIVRFH
ncbi:hypothetical protein PAHAL_9G342200 [Panicum hallii]|uniref:26S proteasome non-ATPase regulatory subunit 4 homolog n=1 Tax=Panicum hallii TaxID=206008 RepID=A0A2S3IMT1_9POAL|nr:26S proteasome non-ATPase regulatory subunit 4 homolog [Panicum hallii]PAN47824.1 hypothetical protein PAHAL_9G342200 [Panicum hallii]